MDTHTTGYASRMSTAARAAAVLAMLSLAACGQRGDTTTLNNDTNGRTEDDQVAGSRGPTSQERARQQASTEAPAPPIELTGCLRKIGGYQVRPDGVRHQPYLLVPGGASGQSVGTSGAKETTGNAPAPARRAYRIVATQQDLEPLVGREVRISGTVVANRALTNNNDVPLSDRDAAMQAGLDPSDLGQVNASTVTQLADRCVQASEAGDDGIATQRPPYDRRDRR